MAGAELVVKLARASGRCDRACEPRLTGAELVVKLALARRRDAMRAG